MGVNSVLIAHFCGYYCVMGYDGNEICGESARFVLSAARWQSGLYEVVVSDLNGITFILYIWLKGGCIL